MRTKMSILVWCAAACCGCGRPTVADPYAGQSEEEIRAAILDNLASGMLHVRSSPEDPSAITRAATQQPIQVEGELQFRQPERTPVTRVTLAVVRRTRGQDVSYDSRTATLEKHSDGKFAFSGPLIAPERPGIYHVIVRDHGLTLAEAELTVR